MREPFRSRSNTSSSGRIRDAEIESIESRSREGSHGQGWVFDPFMLVSISPVLFVDILEKRRQKGQ